MAILLGRVGEVEKSIFEHKELEGRRRPRRGPVAWNDRKGKRDVQVVEFVQEENSLCLRFTWSDLSRSERAQL